MRTEAFPEPLIPVMITSSGGRGRRADDFFVLPDAFFEVLFDALIDPARVDFRGFMQWIVASNRAMLGLVVGADCDTGASRRRAGFVSIPPRR